MLPKMQYKSQSSPKRGWGILNAMVTPLIAGNWKMHKSPSEALVWLEVFLEELVRTNHRHAEILLNVPATHIASLAGYLGKSPVALGAQDLSEHDEGAFTGEISGSMLRNAGATFVLVGHSERREHHHENDELVSRKLQAALRHDLVPILCVGETESQRDEGNAIQVVLKQLRTALKGIEFSHQNDFAIAYEPVWAIGTGRTATASDAQEMLAAIRMDLKGLFPDLFDKIRLLYGGSMKPENSHELLGLADINGGLIGGSSLDQGSLLAIIRAAR